MKKYILGLISILAILYINIAIAGTLLISWNVSEGAEGYKVYTSPLTVDTATNTITTTWTEVLDTINTTASITLPNEDVITLISISAYNANGESWRLSEGFYHNSFWGYPELPRNLKTD